MLALIGGALPAGATDAEDGDALLLERAKPIKGLSFSSSQFDVRKTPSSSRSSTPLQIIVEGRFERPQWNLLAKTKRVPLKDGRFRLILPLRVPESGPPPVIALLLRAVGPYGEVETERVRIRYVPPTPSRWELEVHAGYMSLAYQQTGITDYSGTFLAGRLFLAYRPTTSRFFVEAEGLGTAMAMSETPLASGVRWMQADLRLGYQLQSPETRSPTRWSILTGPIGTGMMVEGDAFGFAGQFRWLLSPRLHYVISETSDLFLDPRFALVFNGAKPLGFDSREMGVHVRYRFGSWAVGLGYGKISFAIESTTGSIVEVSSSSLLLSGGYRF